MELNPKQLAYIQLTMKQSKFYPKQMQRLQKKMIEEQQQNHKKIDVIKFDISAWTLRIDDIFLVR